MVLTLSREKHFLRILVAKRRFFGIILAVLKVWRAAKSEGKAIFMEQNGVFAHHICAFYGIMAVLFMRGEIDVVGRSS